MKQKTLASRLRNYLRNFIAFMFSNVGIIGLVVSYTIAGNSKISKNVMHEFLLSYHRSLFSNLHFCNRIIFILLSVGEDF